MDTPLRPEARLCGVVGVIARSVADICTEADSPKYQLANVNSQFSILKSK